MFRRKTKCRILILICLLVIWFMFEIWSSYHWIDINTYEVQTENVEQEIKLVVLADLHDYDFGNQNEELIEKVSEQAPDLIIMAGDMLNENSENSATVTELIEEFVQVAPIYYAMGNHELAYMEFGHEELYEELESAGAVLLEKEYQDVYVKNNVLRLGGMYDYAFALDDFNSAENAPQDIKLFLEEYEDTSACKIMISHRPDSFILGNASEYWDIDLVISAHNHGGQVVLPFAGGLYGGDQGWFPEYVHGLYDIGNMEMLVTSGLGSEEQVLPRWNNRPEIAVITIKGK